MISPIGRPPVQNHQNVTQDTYHAPKTMMTVSGGVSLGGVVYALVVLNPTFGIFSLFMLGVSCYGRHHFEISARLKSVFERLQSINASLETTSRTLQESVDGFSTENTTLEKSNEELTQHNQELQTLMNNIKEESTRLKVLKIANRELFEKNQELNGELEKTTNKLEVLRSIITEENKKLEGTSLKLSEEVNLFKGNRKRLAIDVQATIHRISKRKKPSRRVRSIKGRCNPSPLTKQSKKT